MRFTVLLSSLFLLAGLLSANMPGSHRVADLGPCRGCEDTSMHVGNGGQFDGFSFFVSQ